MHRGEGVSTQELATDQQNTLREKEQPKPWPAFLLPPYSSRSNLVLLHINHTRQD